MGYESVFCKKLPPWMRRQQAPAASTSRPDDSLDDDDAATASRTDSDTSSALLPNLGLSTDIQTVLDTGAIKLMRSMHANTATELRQQVSVPIWVFTNTGPNV